MKLETPETITTIPIMIPAMMLNLIMDQAMMIITGLTMIIETIGMQVIGLEIIDMQIVGLEMILTIETIVMKVVGIIQIPTIINIPVQLRNLMKEILTSISLIIMKSSIRAI